MLLYYVLIPTLIFSLAMPLFFKLGWHTQDYVNLYLSDSVYDRCLNALKSYFYLAHMPLLISHVWFIRNVVIVSIIYNAINKYLGENLLKIQAIISVTSVLLFYGLQAVGYSDLWVNLFFSYPLFYLGHLLQEKKLLDNLNSLTEDFKTSIMYSFGLIIFMFVFGIFYPKNEVNIFSLKVESIFFMFIMTCSAFIVLYILSKYFPRKFLIYCGEHSVKILIIHGVALKLVVLLLRTFANSEYSLSTHYVPIMTVPIVFITAILGSLFSFILVYIYNYFKKMVFRNSQLFLFCFIFQQLNW